MIKKVSASNLARVMNCAGSLFFKDLIYEEQSEAAKEGEAAGEYLEKLLTFQAPGTHARNGVEFTDEMKFYATELFKEIEERRESEVLCEAKVHWQSYPSGIVVKAKYDASYIHNNTLVVDDLKYGYGLVEAEGNWQLLAYAIGETIRRNEVFDYITMRILQPRAHHEDGPIREWTISYAELLNYKDKIDQQLNKIAAGFDELATGSWCKYCPAAAECPAANKAYHRGVEVLHSFVQDTLDEFELSFQLELINRIEELVKTRKSSLEMLAVDRIKNGKLIPNYICDNRFGNRSWKKSITPEAVKLMTGVDITEKTVLTPAKAEKVGVPKELMEFLTERKLLGQKLVRKDAGKMADKLFGKPKEVLA